MKEPTHLTPEQVIELFKRNGQELTYEQAQKVLEFVIKLAHIAVEQALRNQEQNP